MKIGNPIEPMLVAESGVNDSKFKEIIKKHKGKTLAEVKYDGYRIQVHKDKDISLYTRGLNQLNLEVFPDIKGSLKSLPKGIYDGELVGYKPGLEGFNSVKKRVRGDLDVKLVQEHPLQIKFFDILQLENEPVIKNPLTERRKILEKYIENISDQELIINQEQLKSKFDSVIKRNLEGLVCKNPDSLYLIGKKTKDWIKLKNFLTLDLAILGLYKGEGKMAELPFAAVLLGTKNNEKYETIAKVGIFNKEMINYIYGQVSSNLVSSAPNNVVISKVIEKKTYARKIPFSYIQPQKSLVVEVKCLNITKSKNYHSCGLDDKNEAYSLRIATIERLRTDKAIKDCTTTEQISELYGGS